MYILFANRNIELKHVTYEKGYTYLGVKLYIYLFSEQFGHIFIEQVLQIGILQEEPTLRFL